MIISINKLLPETNMTGDFYSTKKVLESIKDKTIFPASDFTNLSLTLEDIKPYTKNNNLMKLLYEDTKMSDKDVFNLFIINIFQHKFCG